MSLLARLTIAVALVLSAAFGFAQVAPQGALLVVTKQSHALAIVDATTLKVVGTIPIGVDPHEVVIAPDNRTAYISNYDDARLHIITHIDLVAQKALAPIDISPLVGAHGVFFHSGKLWFTAGGSNALGVLDPATGRVESVLGTGQDNTHLVWVSADGNRVVASNAGSGTLSIFDRVTTQSGASDTSGWRHTLLQTGLGAEGFAVSPDERTAWAGDMAGSITVVDLAQENVVTKFPANVPWANRLKFTPDGRRVLVTTHSGKDLAVFDAASRTLVKRVPIEEFGASGIQIQPDGSRAFIACPRDHFVAVVDLAALTRTATIAAGREPDGLAWWSR